MSKGKYSPALPYHINEQSFGFNSRGKFPRKKMKDEPYDEQIHNDSYDKDGFDRYGYSAYSSDGEFVGSCLEVDRNGITELEYMAMSEEEFNSI
jgi:hypothetical protein